MSSYDKDPAKIYEKSFATIRREADLSSVPEDLEPVVVRMIHSCGMVDLVKDIEWSDGAGLAGRKALEGGAPILVDAMMVDHGITRSRLLHRNSVLCLIHDPSTRDLALEQKTTRAAAAVDGWKPWLEGAVVAIGNAPTSLFRLIELLKGGAPRPALIIGVPVGFVGAQESKRALVDAKLEVPFLTVHGRRGGSAIASGAVNALCGPIE